MIDPLIHNTLTGFLAVVLIVSGVKKLTDTDRYRTIADTMGQGRSVVLPVVLALIELLIAAGLLTDIMHKVAAYASIALFTGYGLILVKVLREGRTIEDCGCSWGQQSVLHPSSLSRNLFLVIIALSLVTPVKPRALDLFDQVNMLLGTGAILTFYVALDAFLSIYPQTVRRS